MNRPDPSAICVFDLLREQGQIDGTFQRVETLENLQDALSRREWSLLLIGAAMVTPTPAEVLEVARKTAPHLQAFVIAEQVAPANAVDLMRMGARGFVETDDPQRLIQVVRDVLDLHMERLATYQKQIALQYQATVLAGLSDAVVATDSDLRITAWNEAATRIYGWTQDEAMGQPIDEFLGTEWLAEDQLQAQKMLLTTGHWEGEIGQRTRTGKRSYIFASVNRLEINGKMVGGVTVNRDITRRKRQDRFQARLQQVLEAMTIERPLKAILEQLTTAVEEFEPDLKASVLLLDKKAQTLHQGASPSLPAAYNAAIEGLAVGAGVGSCGTAAFEGRLVIVEDIQAHPYWAKFRDLAAAHGLRACWSQPIVDSEGSVLGTFALYYDHVRHPMPSELDLIALLAHLASIAIQRVAEITSIRESQALLQGFMRHIPGTVYIFDSQNVLTYCNSQFADSIGTQVEQILGKRIYDIWPSEFAQRVRVENQQTLTQNKEQRIIASAVTEGKLSYWEIVKFPIPQGDAPPLVGCIGTDLTREKEAEANVRASEEKYRTLIESSDAAISMLDRTGHYLYVNQIAAGNFNLSPEEAVGRTVQDLFPDQAEVILRDVQRVIDRNEGLLLKPKVTIDGEDRWFRTSLQPVRDSAGIPYAAMLYATDITSEKLVEQEIYRQNQILQQSRDLIALADLHGRITYMNQGGTDMLGSAAPSLVLGKHIPDFHFPEDAHRVMQEYLPTATNTGIWRGQNRLKTFTGRAIDVDQTIFPIRETSGQIMFYATIITDITNRKRAEDALQEAHRLLERRVIERTAELERVKNRLEAIFNHSGDSILVLDVENGIQQANYAFDALLGRPAESYLGQPLKAFFEPEFGSYIDAHIDRVAKTLQSQQVEALLTRPNGEAIDIEMSISPIQQSEQMPTPHLVCILRNVTARREAEVALQNYALEVHDLYNQAPNGHHSLDADGKIIQINDTELQWLGYRRDEVINLLKFTELLTPASVRIFMEHFPRFKKDGRVDNLEIDVRRKDGSTFTVLVNAVAVYDESGEYLYSRSTLFDITQLKASESARQRSEQQLRESQKMLQLVLDTIPVRVFWKDRDSVYLGCNRLFADDAGLAYTADIVGKRDADLPWTAHESAAFRADDLAIISTGTPKRTYDEVMSIANGEKIFVQTTKLPLLGAANNVIGVLGSYIDVTDQRVAETALAQKHHEEQQMQTYLKALHHVTLQLTRAENLDDFYRLTVELAVQYFGFDRVDMLLYGPTEGMVLGTYGINLQGKLVSQHVVRRSIDVNDSQYDMLRATQSRTERFSFEPNAVLHDMNVPIGMGHKAVAALWNDELLGWLCVDNALSRAPFSKAQLDILGLYAIATGSLLARRQAEFALRESEKRYRLLAENVRDVIVKLSPDGTIMFVTPSVYHLLGYRPDELIGTQGYDLVHPDDIPVSQKLLADAIQVGISFLIFVERLKHKEGHFVWVEVSNTTVFEPNSLSPIEMIGSLRDITERKLAEDHLRASEEKFRSFIESAPIATIITDYRGEIALVNRAAEVLLEYPRAELINQPVQLLIPAQVHPLHNTLFEHGASAFGKHPNSMLDISIQRKGGAAFPADIQISHIDIKPQPMIMSFIIDTSKQKAAEKALKQALAQEKELGELKSRFVSMASHEFRTPLAAILATAETLTLYREKMDATQVNIRLDRIRQQVLHMKHIMEDVLNLARIHAGRIEFHPTRGDMDAICQEVIEEFESQAIHRGRIQYHAQVETHAFDFDVQLMRQIVSNLISNALKYSPREKPIKATLIEDAGELIFTVHDDGIGIPPDDLKHIFDPFHRGTNVTNISGTGLGLSIAKQAVDLHHGRIILDTRLNVGSTFTVYIPITSVEGNNIGTYTGD